MTGSYWHRDAGWTDRWRGRAVPERLDFAIVGGGFAGLMTAIRLRELHPRAAIAILEAERIGYGASGRNAGFLSPLAAPVWLLGAARSREQAWGAARLNAEVHAVAEWIAEHVPACELAPATLSMRADGRVGAAALRDFTAAIALVGLEHRVRESRVRRGFDSVELAAYTLHPYKLARGLAEHAEWMGATVHEGVRVRRLEAVRSGGARVHLDGRAVLHAGKVVLCTNAYTSSIELGERAPATLVVHGVMAATSPATAGPLVRDGDFTVEVNAAQTYHRMHRGRVIYGGLDKLRAPEGGDFTVSDRERARLAAHVRASFPGHRLAIEHAWSGCFQTTATGLPVIRTSDDNFGLVYNIGYGGTGVALALVGARLAASVASNGQWTDADAPRLLALVHATRPSLRDGVRALARIARSAAMPWLGA